MKYKVSHKIFALFFTLTLFSTPLFAVDFGGSLTASFDAIGHTPPYLDQSWKYGVVAWLKAPLNLDNSLNLSLQGSYVLKDLVQYAMDEQGLPVGEKSLGHAPDLDLLKVSYTRKDSSGDSFTLSAGRFQYSDITATIFSQTCDGVLFQYNGSAARFNVYTGYTGLLNQNKIFILDRNGKNYQDLDADEEEDEDDDEIKIKDLYSFADPYFISTFSVSLPYLFLNQTVGLEVGAFMGSDSPWAESPNYNRYYASISFSGPLEPGLYYSLTSTLETEDFEHVGNLTQLNFTYFPKIFKDSVFTWSTVYASGNDNGPFARFRGFTSNSVSYSRHAPELTGVLKTGFNLSLKPLRNLVLIGGADMLFACPDDDIRYDGWQWHADIRLQVTNDFQIAISEFRYLGYESMDPNNSGATVKFILSF